MTHSIMVPGFKPHGGKHCETTAANHVLRYQGIELSEELLFGLGGGIGFIYWYMKKMNAPLVGGRAGGRDFNLIDNILRRIGGSTEVLTTGSSKKAYDWLIDDLKRGEPVICYGDMAYLPYFGVGEDEHFGGHVFVVYGVDSELDRVWIADGGTEPFFVTRGNLEQSRGSKHPPFPPHNMMIRVHAPQRCSELGPGILESVQGCITGMREAPIANIGIKGMGKWAAQVRKWPGQFPGRGFVDCLMSTFLYIEVGGTGGSAFRSMYATFLREAADITGIVEYRKAAELYDRCAEQWKTIAYSALPNDVDVLRRCRELLFERDELMENNGPNTVELARDANRRIATAIEDAVAGLTSEQTAHIVEDLQGKILALRDLEQAALDGLAKAVA